MNLQDSIPVFEKIVNDISLIQQHKEYDLYSETISFYPYFQTAQLFYIISKYQTESIFSDVELKQAAIYCGSRAKLHDYLNNERYISEITEYKLSPDLKETEDIKPEQAQAVSTTKDAKVQANILIDKFIKENPSIQKTVSEFFSPSTMAAKSLEEDIDLATETLAKIYIKKGNYTKAIRIYQKLMLYYPEKSNYFATLIDSLRDKINE